MNILIFSWRGPGHPNTGGAEFSTHEHAKAWVKAGHSVTLFTSFFEGSKREEFLDGVRIIRKGFDIFGVHILAFFWYFFGEHQKFDLVVDQFHGIPFFTPLYVKTCKLGFIHEVAKEVWWLNPWPKPFNLLPGIIGTLFESLIFKLLYRKIPFMTVSNSTKEDLVEWGIPPSKISIVHNGVSAVPVKTEKDPKKTIMFLGALAKDKGIEDAVRTFALIERGKGPFQFWVVGWGNPDYVKKLKILCKKLGISTKVKFWGFVGNVEKFKLLSRAHVLLNPSVREGWGLVNIEANTMGTPVVGYRVPGVCDSVIDGKTGLLSVFGDHDALAKNALELLNNEALYSRISRASLNWSKQFTWAKSTEKSLRFIKSL